MNYSDTINYLYTHFPCFQQKGKTAYVPSLQNTQDILAHLGNPEVKIPCVHVAGTNGKGSTSHFIASILQEAGYKVGLYTSPHLVDFTERIRINGKNIPKRYITSFVNANKIFLESKHASLFEVTTAMAFDYFYSQKVDIAVIEVGLGGRLDSTNIITPLVSVITNIGFDHMQILGNSLREIAQEKAGIIKETIPVIIGETNPETRPVFNNESQKKQSCITFAQDKYTIHTFEKQSNIWDGEFEIYKDAIACCKAKSGLLGEYQKKNVVTVFAAIEQLKQIGYKISNSAIKNGYANIITNTNLQGRWQMISKNPLVICDTGHNYDGISYTMPQLQTLGKSDIRIVWGMVGDKDIDSIINLLPNNATYYLTKPNIERAMPIERLEPFFENKKHTTYTTISRAYQAAKQKVTSQTVIYVGGSSYVVAEFLSKKSY